MVCILRLHTVGEWHKHTHKHTDEPLLAHVCGAPSIREGAQRVRASESSLNPSAPAPAVLELRSDLTRQDGDDAECTCSIHAASARAGGGGGVLLFKFSKSFHRAFPPGPFANLTVDQIGVAQNALNQVALVLEVEPQRAAHGAADRWKPGERVVGHVPAFDPVVEADVARRLQQVVQADTDRLGCDGIPGR